MKFRESGMPQEEVWKQFFHPAHILNNMDLTNKVNTIIDIGCGYGTFLLPISKIASKVIGIDIEKEMVEVCKNKLQENGILNTEVIQGDIATEETIKDLNKYTGDIEYITLFNILHCEEPVRLLKSVYKLLNPNGKIGIIHWKYENTPRGPSMSIRPQPQIIIEWAKTIGFTLEKQVELPPYHYGLVFVKG